MISKDLLDILCCPETKADLVLDGDTLVSADKETRRLYRIEDDIPIMLAKFRKVGRDNEKAWNTNSIIAYVISIVHYNQDILHATNNKLTNQENHYIYSKKNYLWIQ